MGSWNLPGLTSNGDLPTQLKKSPLQPLSPLSPTMISTRNAFFMALATLMLLQTSVFAANCTSDEQTTVENAYADLANSTSCGDLISDTGATSLDYCMNSDCVAELSDAVDQLPDCTGDDEINRKTGLQNIVTYCSNVTEVLEQSASASGSGDATGSGSVVSGAAFNVVMATGAAVAQLSVVLFFFAELL